MKKKLLSILSCCALFGYAQAQTEWEDKTSLIKNPSFEEGEAAADLTTVGWATSSVTSWNISPTETPANSQVGIGNSSSTTQGVGSSFNPGIGDKYFYLRCNWQAATSFSVSQTIDATNLPKGLYKLTCKIATTSSSPGKTKWTLSIKEGDKEAVTNTNIGAVAYWLNAGVLIYKEADETTLTISASMLPGAAGGSQHYAMLLDDIQLHYVSAENFAKITPDNTLDVSDVIYNAQIYNVNNTVLPCGWQEYERKTGNSNRTEKTGDTQLEGWNNNTLSIDYYQPITSLLSGMYSLTSYCHDSNDTGAYVYIFNSSTNERMSEDMKKEYADVTTGLLTVNQGESVNIGIKAENVAGTWCTGDNFRLTYNGSELNVKKVELGTLKSKAKVDYLENSVYQSVVGTEREELSKQISVEVGEETVVAYQTAIDNLQHAINEFVANYEAYGLLGREIQKAESLGSDVTIARGIYESETRNKALMTNAVQDLKVTEYNYVADHYSYGVELGTWTSEGPTGSLKDQHWSGESREYLEQSSAAYGWDSWNIKYSQDLQLPAGDYVFKVAGRKQIGENCTLQLVVTDNDTELSLGSVDDFPEGDKGLGINKNGATSFDTNDVAGFANSGAGRGWEWRYVKFTLTKETSVNVAVIAAATAKWQYISFCDATVQTNDDATISRIAYNIALNEANAALANNTYDNVTGKERTDLQTAINADPGTTKESIGSATTTLVNTTRTFTNALSSYNNFIGAKTEVSNNIKEELPYALKEKYETITASVNKVPQSAEEASLMTSDIYNAFRSYIESNALAEGIEKAENKTSLVKNPLFTDGKNGWTSSQSGGNEQILNSESFTDGTGASDYHYYDYWNGDNNIQHLTQTISGLEPGKYLLTVTVRGATSLNGLQLEAGNVTKTIPCIGNAGGQFGRGWNDVSLEFEHNTTSDVTIGVQATQGNSSHNGWFSFTRVRLVKLGSEVSVPVTINAGKYATRIFPFVPDFGENADVKVYSCAASDDNNNQLNLVEVTEPAANTPYILYSEGGYEQTLTGWYLATENEYSAGLLVGKLAEGTITSGYVLQTQNEKQAFYKVSADDPIAVPAYRVYIKNQEAEAAGVNALALVLPDHEATSIESVAADDAIVNVYNINGILVRKDVKASDALRGLQPGLYIVDGVKKIVK